MSRRVLLAALVATTIASTAIAQDKPAEPSSLTGKWQMTLEMEVGTASPVLVFKQDGEKLSGTYTGRYGTYPLVGTIVKRQVDFVVTINAEGMETKMTFTGELDAAGAVVKGSADLGGMGAAGWMAKRAEK